MENILINVDSRFRNKEMYPDAGKFTIKLNQKIKDVLYVRLSSVEIPNLYHTFSKDKQNVSFTVKTNNITTLIVIDDGFYDSVQMLENIQKYLPPGMTINLNLANGFVTFECANSFTIDFTNQGEYPSLGYQLGFRNNMYTSVAKTNTIQYIKTEAQLDTIGDNYLFLRINDYGKMYNFNKSDNTNNTIKKDDVVINPIETLDSYLGKVILTVNKAEKNFDNHNFITKKHVFRQPTNIGKLDIELMDPLGNIINTLFMNYSFTLELGVIYDRELYEQSLNSLNLLDNPLYKINNKKDEDMVDLPINNLIVKKLSNIKTPIIESIDENINNLFVNKPVIVPVDENIDIKPPKKSRKKKFNFSY